MAKLTKTPKTLGSVGHSSVGFTIGQGKSHGKLILLGEHTVVYGRTAIAYPLSTLTVHAQAQLGSGIHEIESPYYTGPVLTTAAITAAPHKAIEMSLALVKQKDKILRIKLHSDLPMSRGLGSSAAVAAAIAGAICDLFKHQVSAQDKYEIVQAAEQIAHGKSSGLDASAICAGEAIVFQDGRFTNLKTNLEAYFIIADTGVHGLTRKAVSDVRNFHNTAPKTVNKLLDEAEVLTQEALRKLATGDEVGLGKAMFASHKILQKLGVSHPQLDALVNSAKAHGALGAKLTGGGQGGCIVALTKTATEAAALGEYLLAEGAANIWISPSKKLN